MKSPIYNEMQETTFLKRIINRAQDAALFIFLLACLAVWVVYATVAHPQTLPSGAPEGGVFTSYFQNMQWNCSTGSVVAGFNNDMSKICTGITP